MNIDLLPFQTRAADQIAARFFELDGDPRRPTEHRHWDVPFYQAISSVTGSGKTVIVADTLSQIRAGMALEPIVLWLSKNKAVVDQTHANFETGGKYAQIIEGFNTTYLSAATISQVLDDTQPIVMFATVGTFNRNQASRDFLRVHQTAHDENGMSTWSLMKERRAPNATSRRPLIVVYDEAHNLSDQQTDLLFELEPQVILAASATMRTPGKLGQVIERLRQSGWSDRPAIDPPGHPSKCLVTAVATKEPVAAGLIKRQIMLGGYTTEMEISIDDMIEEFERTDKIAQELNTGFRPKAIYVCQTNVSQEDGLTDNPQSPFLERKAPPILIWRYLTEQKKIPAALIAIYGDLKVDQKSFPLPSDCRLFSGGDDDFSAFAAGNYRHIIFNQSLQEGWDDPECGFAYIDKAMASPTQVEQVIGRALRQPGARHYADPALNTANFYIRTGTRQEFQKILDTVKKRIAGETPDVLIEDYSDQRNRSYSRIEPIDSKVAPEIHIDSDAAVAPLIHTISTMHDYTNDSVNTVGAGEVTRVVQPLGSNLTPVIEMIRKDHSNRVIARWIVRRHMQTLYPEAVKTVDWADPKFDVRVEVASVAAAALRELAERLVDTYLENSQLAFEDANPYVVPPALVKLADLEYFSHALHKGYSDLKPNELDVAHAIDATGLTWVRNPVNGGFAIPLLEKGESRRFYPDFLVWKGNDVFAIDPKGKHLLMADAGRKLLSIRDERGRQRLIVRFITDGQWSYETMRRTAVGGLSVWRMNTSGQLRCTHHRTTNEAIQKALQV